MGFIKLAAAIWQTGIAANKSDIRTWGTEVETQLAATQATVVSEDVSPKLGGRLDANGNIVSQSWGAPVIGAASVTLAGGNVFIMSGAMPVSGFNVIGGATEVTIIFNSVLTLVDSASFILKAGGDIVTKIGDVGKFIQENGSSAWRLTTYDRFSGGALAFAVEDNAINATALNVIGDGEVTDYLRSNGDGSFSWVKLIIIPTLPTSGRYELQSNNGNIQWVVTTNSGGGGS